ncbi:aldehyde dehydrogenase family protein [Rhizobium leguminosarum]|uniref:NAD-dependent succinate-semialdehyde dehydrogenase n=1 Tax=Rhizobium leguminosarum TaxID=384 RepID=UPI0013C0E5CF|nr:NAD-dependent succinate-semialdehyde dehydrogenase [Rhizobium leguminosarum]MBY5313508.1 NAD-dependent succinate-semialdehyde dehydrogenase [Rhizobium leguminosarum]MBY5327342.1 NAD-dependent succinate-semialdehyde dehydrogenase [Rhizobium leguminosarum]MBY5395187.1 NAD-dependent succinate-semialdehyde dehydrogenase [Rhizobium leguminosarum]NEH47202.1 aldehyde dehydrogenase family protein [Rhizobium leguminosarum]NEH56912.1 aldehyde dehydrogenase family protein [Rhizobium leguminosarum]
MAYQSVNPATGKVLKTFNNHSDDEIEKSLNLAHSLYKSPWCKGDRGPRLKVLNRFANLAHERLEELARILTLEMGKRINEARTEVRITADIAQYYAGNAESLLAREKVATSKGDAWLEYHPIGVVVAVEPWNFPFYQLIRVAGPNLAIGNPVLAKHASMVPQAAIAFEELLTEAGAPEGAWTNLFATGDQISRLIADDRVQGVALTGSEGAGSIVAANAGKNLKKSVMELGGSDVFVVLDDADVDKAVAAGVEARLRGCGQVCNGAKRFLIHEKIADEFVNKLAEKFTSTKIGDPMDETVGLGPMSSIGARDDIAGQVERAVKAGARVLVGGSMVEGPGAYYQPTILTHVTRDNPAYFEEFFGPVAQVHVIKSDDDVVRIANDSNFGLSGAIFTADVERAKSLASQVETGSVWINTSSFTGPELPFGGVKKSGYGRELAGAGIKELVNQKMVLVAH